MNVGDVLEWQCPKFPHVIHRWRVFGIHLGASGQESLIECESITHEPGWTGQWEYHPRMFVPTAMINSYSPSIGDLETVLQLLAYGQDIEAERALSNVIVKMRKSAA